jgi:gas vesicle protein
MGKFLLGFALGMGVGAGLAILLTPESGQVNRERLRAKTEQYAAGEETPIGTLTIKVEEQRNVFQRAIEAGRRASAERQAELWAQLNLTPPTTDDRRPTTDLSL